MSSRSVKKTISVIIMTACAAAVLLVCVLWVSGGAPGAETKVIVADDDIKKGTIIKGSDVESLFSEKEVKDAGEECISDRQALEGMIVTEDIQAGRIVETGMLADGYGPADNIDNPVVMGIRALECSQFVSGIIRAGDMVNISVVDSMTNECEKVIDDVYVCGAYNDDGTVIEDEGSAMYLNILVDREDEMRINSMINKGIIRISKTGGGTDD